MDWADKIALNIYNKTEVKDLPETIAQALREARKEGARDYGNMARQKHRALYGHIFFMPDPTQLPDPS